MNEEQNDCLDFLWKFDTTWKVKIFEKFYISILSLYFTFFLMFFTFTEKSNLFNNFVELAKIYMYNL